MSRYLEILFRFWIRFAILLILLPVAVAVASVILFPSYKGSAALWVDYPIVGGSRFVPIGWNQYLTPAQNESDKFTQLISTRSFVGTLGDRLAASGAVKDPAEQRSALSSIYTTFKVNAAGSNLLVLGVSCDRRPVCVAILTEAIKLFTEQDIKLAQDSAQYGLAFVSGQLKDAQAAEKSAEDALTAYLSQHPNLSPTAASAALSPELARLMADLSTKQSNVRDLQASLDQLEYLSSATTRMAEIGPQVMDAPHISNAGLLGDGTSLKRALIAVSVCLAIGGGYLILLTWLDKTARDSRELERRVKVRVITSIPKMKQLETITVE